MTPLSNSSPLVPQIHRRRRRRITLPQHLRRSTPFAQAPLASTYTAPPILLNQLGYLPKHAKLATVLPPNSRQSLQPPTFRLRSANNSVVLEGKLSTPSLDAASGDTTAQADFSALTTPGTYQLEVDGTLSDPFTIAPPSTPTPSASPCAATTASAAAATSISATATTIPPAISTAPSTPPPAAPAPSPTPAAGTTPATTAATSSTPASPPAPSSGPGSSTPTPSTPSRSTSPNPAAQLPDFLAEIKWNLNWMLSLQDPTDGGVWHKQTSLHFCAFIMPQDDHLPSEIIGTGAAPYKSTCATADFAAVMAIAARCYQPFDPAFAARCLAAARAAWTWASKHPNVIFTNPPTVSTGDYGDNDCSDELLWASAELFRTTRDPQYEAAFLDSIKPLLPNLKITVPSWNNVASLGLWTYALATSPRSPSAGHRPPSSKPPRPPPPNSSPAPKPAATAPPSPSPTTTGAPTPTPATSPSCYSSPITSNPTPPPVNAALSNLHYLLGRNCFGVSWVTQLGHRPFQHPHHRPSAADGIAAPWPGLLSGGPNAHGGDASSRRPPQSPTHAHVARRPARLLHERNRHQLERPASLPASRRQQPPPLTLSRPAKDQLVISTGASRSSLCRDA